MTIDPKRIEAALQPHYPSTILRPGDALYTVAVGLYSALAAAQPASMRAVTSVVLSSLETLSQRVSVTIGSVIVLSPAAVADDVTHAATIAHEVTHRTQVERAGIVQVAVDYLGSGELRSQREADASAAGLWMRYVLTGDLPVEAPTLADLYHLDAGDAAMARSIIAAHLATIRAGVVPNLDVCVVLAKWFRAQTDIPADVLARVAVVP